MPVAYRALRQEANNFLNKFSTRANGVAGVTPERVVREGNTAEEILKLIEERFGLSKLTKRDAAQVPMDDPATGFFDFTNQNWQVPPGNLPAQTVLGQSACFVDPPPTSP